MGANIAAAVICTLAVPVLMASQEWDDHDRSNKTLARDLATDYLQSCAPNAIVISFGDNDTYPLWYAQEVEGIRRDVRVINQSLLGTDWYINQLRYKINQSDPIDPIWSADQIEGSARDFVQYNPNVLSDKTQFMDLYTMMKDYAGSDDPAKGAVMQDDGEIMNTFPSKNVSIPVDVNLVKQNGTVNPEDSVVSELKFVIPKNYLYKNDAAILNIIAANKWKRPIYFTSQDPGLGFRDYIRQDGLTYRLVPILNREETVNEPWMVKKMMSDTFRSGNADKPGVYFDEENRRHLNNIRQAYAIAAVNLAQHDKKAEAVKMLEKCDKMMLEENFPYGMVSRFQMHNQVSMMLLQASYLAGDSTLANKIVKSLKKDLEQQLSYYAALDEDKAGVFDYTDGSGRKRGDKNDAERMLMQIQAWQTRNLKPTEATVPISTPPIVQPPKDSPNKNK